jgi:hypothetical protein
VILYTVRPMTDVATSSSPTKISMRGTSPNHPAMSREMAKKRATALAIVTVRQTRRISLSTERGQHEQK